MYAIYDDVTRVDTVVDDVREFARCVGGCVGGCSVAKYLLFTFIMNIVTIVITVVIINWNFRTPRTHRMPRWIRVVFLDVLPRAIMMTRPSHACRWYRTQRALCQAAVGSTDSLRQVRARCVAIRRHFRFAFTRRNSEQLVTSA